MEIVLATLPLYVFKPQMDAVAPLLHAFYGATLSDAERQSVHSRLLEFLTTSACVEHADAYIAHSAAALDVGVSSPSSTNPDALLLHYALHAIETRIRSGYEAMQPSSRRQLLSHLIDFTVAAFSWNMGSAASQNPAGLALISIPQYVIMKSARAAVELGKREWVADATTDFPRIVLALIDQNGHSTGSLQRIFGGMVMLTILVDDALDTNRADVRAADRAVLFKRIGSIADGIVSALEIGLRINGPGLPPTVPAAAARTVVSVTRISPSVASTAIDVLRRRSAGHSCDLVGAEVLGVLAELYGESKIPLPGPWGNVLAHLATLLNPVAMREVATGDSDSLTLYRKRLTAYAEAVLCRCIAVESSSVELEGVLNGLMGCTMRWATENPEAMPDALDAWMNILESLEDAEVEPNKLISIAYGALASLCSKCCMFSSNSSVLRRLDSFDDEDDDCGPTSMHNGSMKLDDTEFLADVATRPAAMASMLLAGTSGAPDATESDEAGEIGFITRATYTSKCIEALISIARVFPATIALQAADLACRALSSPAGVGVGEVAAESMLDKESGSIVCYSVAPWLPCDLAATRSLAAAVADLFGQSPSCRLVNGSDTPGSLVDPGLWRPRLSTNLIRCATALATTFTSPNWPEGHRFATAFVQISRGLLQAGSKVSRPVSLAASILLLTMGDICRQTLFASEPPIPPVLVTCTPHRAISALGIVGAARWALGSSSEEGQGQQNVAAQPTGNVLGGWSFKMAALQHCCGVVFAEFVAVCSEKASNLNGGSLDVLSRGALVTRSMVWSLYDEGPDCKDAVWSAVVRELCGKMMFGLGQVCELASAARSPVAAKMDEDQRRDMLKCIGTLIGAMGCILRVFRRQVSTEAQNLPGEVIAAGLSAAKQEGSPPLARSLLTVLREQIGDGFGKDKQHLVAPGIELASQSLDGDPDVAMAAIGVITECLTRHWLLFFPDDVAVNTVNGKNISAAPAHEANESIRKLYFVAFSSILNGVRHADGSVSRASMLALERLEAQRKLYSRGAAFRDIGGASATIGGCIGAVWSSPLGIEDACAVLWGVGRVDWNVFYGHSGALLGAIRTIGACSDDQGVRLLDSFGQPTDRPTFTRALVALVNDLRYTASMNKGPSI